MKKNKQKIDINNMKYLDDEERELIESIENSDVEAKPISEAEKRNFKKSHGIPWKCEKSRL